jgi:hypothetical protein
MLIVWLCMPAHVVPLGEEDVAAPSQGYRWNLLVAYALPDRFVAEGGLTASRSGNSAPCFGNIIGPLATEL